MNINKSKIHFIDELIVFFMVSMLLRGDHGAARSSMNTFKNKTQMNNANHNKNIALEIVTMSEYQ